MELLKHLRTFPEYNFLSDNDLVSRYMNKYHPNQELGEVDELFREKAEQERQDEFSKLGVLGRGARIGYEQAKDLIFEGGIRGLANYALGREEQAADDFERYTKAQQETQQEFPQVINWKDVDSPDDVADFALQSIGQFGPDLIGGLGSGFVAKQGTKFAAKKIAKDISKESLDKLGKYSMLTGAGGYAAVQNFGETYNQVYADSNGDPDMMKVLLHGTINSALDTILPATIINKMSKEARERVADYALKRMLKGIGKGALVEGATEGAQTLSNELAMTDGWDYFKNFDQVDLEAVEEAFATGFFGGGGIRGGIDLVTGVNPETLARQRKDAEDRQLKTALDNVEKGGGLTEPLIQKPDLEKVPPRRTVRRPKDLEREDRIFWENTHGGEKYHKYQDRMHEESLKKAEGRREEIKKVKDANKKKEAEYQEQLKGAEQKQEFRQTEAFQKSLDFVEGKLNALESSGKQGKQFAKAVRDVMKTPEFSLGEALLAFNSAKIANEIMPQGSGYEVKFAKALSFEGGQAQGLTNKSAKVLSLAFDVGKDQGGKSLTNAIPTLHADTASHEAFHVLQDFWNQHEPKTAKLLNKTFGAKGQSVDYLTSPIRKWIKRIDPNMNAMLEGHSQKSKRGDKNDTSPQGILGSELQAYAFQTYAQARRAGKTPVMAGGLARYFNFMYKYLSRLGNSLRGMGFQNVQDVFEKATTGIYAQKFENLGVTNEVNADPNLNPTEASALGSPGRFFFDRAMTRPFRPTPEQRASIQSFIPFGAKGSPVLTKAKFNPKEKSFPVGIKKGFQVWDESLKKHNGMGYDHIKIGHGRELTEVTGVQDVSDIVQRVVSEGKGKRIGQTPNGNERWNFRLKDPNWSHYVTVAVDKPQSAEGNNYATVITAFPENFYDTKRAVKRTKDQLASRPDIDRYRSVKYDDVAASALNPDRVSTRFPTTKQATEDPYTENLSIGFEETMSSPKMVSAISDLVSNYSLEDGKTKRYNLLTEAEHELPAKEKLEAFVEAMKNNLLYIYDSIDASIRGRSKLWYVGANKIANDLGAKYGISPAQAAGVLAVFSPQKDWYQNVSLAERALDIMFEPKSGLPDGQNMFPRETQVTGEMLEVINGKKAFSGTKDKYIKYVEYLNKERPSLKTLMNTPDYDFTNAGIDGSLLQAMWIRAYDETYNGKSYQTISPEGNKVGLERKDDGNPRKMAWGGFNTIMKALTIANAKDDQINVISREVGSRHKVRNFYNNIIDPNGTHGDVTIDTHAVAASVLKPLGGSDVEVGHNLGTSASDWKGKIKLAPSDNNRGIIGTYGLVAEAHRRAAKERNVLPREMQSITWEAVRGLFTSSWKTAKNKAKVDAIWDRYSDGQLTLQETHEEITDVAGRFRDPVWQRSDSQGTTVNELTNNQRELDQVQLGRDAQSVDSGTRGRTPDGTSDQVEASSLTFDPFTEASSLSVVPDDLMRKAVAKDGVQFKKLNINHDPNDPNSKPFIGSSGLADNAKLFANREVEDGTKVLVRPNLNGWIQEGGPPTVTQTVHKPGATKAEDLTESSYKKGVYGYDKIASVKGSVELDVAQKAREKIATGKVAKLPMAGGYGNLNQISEQEMTDIMQNPDHVIKFNPKTHHLFYNQEDGYAVKGYNGVGVHYNTSVFVKGELDYWSEREAPTALGGVETKVKYIDNSEEASALSNDLWEGVFADKSNDGLINKFVTGLSKFSFKNFGSVFVDDFIDSNFAIRQLEEKVVEAETGVKALRDAELSPTKFAEMMGNTSGRREIMLRRGAPTIDQNGEITLRDDTKGIVEIFMQADSTAELKEFSKYAVARRAKALGNKERHVTPEQIEDGLARETPKFKEMFEEYQKFNQAMLDFLEQAGMIKKKEREVLGSYDYIPFYREMEEDQFDKRTGLFFAKDKLGPKEVAPVMNNPKKPLEKYRGGQAPIGDLVGNTMRNASAFLDAGMKNIAMQKTVDLMREGGIGKDLHQNETGANVLFATYKVKGQNKWYDVEDPRLFRALASLTPRQSVGLFKHMETVGRWFREFITHQPAFIVANYLRGEMSGLVTVDAKVNPVLDSLQGFKNSLTDAESIQEMKLLAGVGGYNFGDDFRSSTAKFQRQLRIKNKDYNLVNSPQAISDMVASMWGGLTKVGEASELAYRDGIYRNLRKEGKSRSEAAYEALNMINFNRKGAMRTPLGSVLGSLIPLVPFLNARIQGLYRTFDPMVTGRQADRKKTILYGSLLTLGALALYAESSEDERYEQEPMHLRLNYHIFYVGDKRYLIPRAFEVGAVFTTLPEFMMGAIKKNDSEELYKATMMTLFNTFAFNPTPQAVRPLIEVATNYDMFRGTFIDSPFEMNYKPSARYSPSTSQISRSVSEATENPVLSLSPNQITKLVTGYLGSMGTTLLTATDVVLSKGDAVPSRPTGVFGEGLAATLAEATGFGRFVKDDLYTGNQFITNFYETKKEVDQIYNTIQRYKRDGQLEVAQEMAKDNRGMLSFRKRLSGINQQLRTINQRIRKVRTDPNLTSEKKRSQLLVLLDRRNKIGRNFDKTYKRLKELDK